MEKTASKTETNAYFTHMAVKSSQQAAILSNRFTWTVLEVLRKSGSVGLTTKMILDEVEKEEGVPISRSKIYDILTRLHELEWVHRYWDTKEHAQRNTLNDIAGQIETNDEFSKIIYEKMKTYVEKNLFTCFQEYIEESINKIESDSKAKKWLPDHGKLSFCKKCHVNHEALEFFESLIHEASTIFLDSEYFEKFLQKKKYQDEKM